MIDKVDPRIRGSQVQEASKKLEIGLIGHIFGDAREKPGNIAGLAVVVSFIIMGCILIWGTDTPTLSKKDAMLVVGGFITLSLGFLFGRSTS